MADDISGSPAEHRGGDVQREALPHRTPHDPPTDLPIRRLLRDGDTLAWLGGTAFAVVQGHVRRPQDAALVAGRISDALAGTFRLGRQEVRVGASVGIACYPDDGTAAAELLRRADLAL